MPQQPIIYIDRILHYVKNTKKYQLNSDFQGQIDNPGKPSPLGQNSTGYVDGLIEAYHLQNKTSGYRNLLRTICVIFLLYFRREIYLPPNILSHFPECHYINIPEPSIAVRPHIN